MKRSLVRTVLLIVGLVVANYLLANQPVEAELIEDKRCISNQGEFNFCDFYPGFICDRCDCTHECIEP